LLELRVAGSGLRFEDRAGMRYADFLRKYTSTRCWIADEWARGHYRFGPNFRFGSNSRVQCTHRKVRKRR
jgi:hypothetical protein